MQHVDRMLALPLLVERTMRVTFIRLTGVVWMEVAKATLNLWKSDSWCGCQVCQNGLLRKVDADLGHECFQCGVRAVFRGRWRRLRADGSRRQGEYKGDCA